MLSSNPMASFSRRTLLAVLILCALFHPPAMQGQSLTFTNFAGTTGGSGFKDGTGSAARFNVPFGVATDRSGNVYVADTVNHTIRKITPEGAVTTLAGLAETRGSADGTGSAARFDCPYGVATDSSGNVYVADTCNHTIRKITPKGAVTTLAGLAQSWGSADGTGSAARFHFPFDVATDGSGNIYVADRDNNTIRKVSPAGTVTTLAGLAGSSGYLDATGSDARFNEPRAVSTDNSGNIYVADTNNNSIRKVTPAGAVRTIANLVLAVPLQPARFPYPNGLATDSIGNVYVADTPYYAIRKIGVDGTITTLAGLPGSQGNADGIGSAARFVSPYGLATDSSGNVYVIDTYSHAIRKITPDGSVTTLAGLGASGASADGKGSAARFWRPDGLAADSSGNVYVGDSSNHTIRKITRAGEVTTLAGLAGNPGSTDGTGNAARFNLPTAVAAGHDGNVYVADTFNHTIRKISPAGAVTTLAGLAGDSGSTDGTGSAARFYYPQGVAADSSGNVYVTDNKNTIRKISAAGTVTTLAGLAGIRGSADGIGSAAQFDFPQGVTTDDNGNVYVSDLHNQTIRKISAAGVVTTFAGLADTLGSDDGTGSAARFNYPSGVATDRSGNVYVTDSSNQTIRKIDASGTVTTLAGLAGRGGSADGTGSTVRFNYPRGIATDASGVIYVADTGSHRIRIGRAVLEDVATIDVSSGSSASTRLLDTSPQTATSWQWSVIRRPADSVATLSSASVRNPTFTPDVPGLFTFQLVATGAEKARITTVDLLVSQPPRRRSVGK
jgi:sugar lactone lactonase YvrE